MARTLPSKSAGLMFIVCSFLTISFQRIPVSCVNPQAQDLKCEAETSKIKTSVPEMEFQNSVASYQTFSIKVSILLSRSLCLFRSRQNASDYAFCRICLISSMPATRSTRTLEPFLYVRVKPKNIDSNRAH